MTGPHTIKIVSNAGSQQMCHCKTTRSLWRLTNRTCEQSPLFKNGFSLLS